MKHLAKLVTGILLIALPAMPGLAALPCQQSALPMPCCHGMRCAAMAKMTSHGAINHEGRKGVPAPCCEMHVRSFVAVTDHPSIDVPVADRRYSNDAAHISPPRKQPSVEDARAVSLRRGQCTQALLSTFHI